MLKRIGIVDLFGVILVACLIAQGKSWAGDPGIGWHLRTGEWITQNGIPHVDPFLIHENKPWVHDQWLSDFLFWRLYSFGGWAFLQATCVALVIFTFFGVVSRYVHRVVQEPIIAALVTLLVALLAATQWVLRPVLFSVFLFAYVYTTLSRALTEIVALRNSLANSPASKFSKSFLFLPLVFALWANLHPAFILGLGVFGIMLVLSILPTVNTPRLSIKNARVFLCVFVFSALATLFNPNGFELYRSIAALGSSQYFMNLNSEWLSTDFHISLFVPWAFGLVGLLTISLVVAQTKISIPDLVFVFLFTILGLLQRRYIPFAGIVVGPVLGRICYGRIQEITKSTLKQNQWTAAMHAISQRQFGATQMRLTGSCVIALLVFSGMTSSWPGQEATALSINKYFPVDAVDALEVAQSTAPIFHTPDWGGYLIWRLGPREQVFIDDRNQLHSPERYEEFLRADAGREGWRTIFAHYGFQWALLKTDSPLRLHLEGSPEWAKVYADSHALLFRMRDKPQAQDPEQH